MNCTRCENYVLAYYDCIGCCENICEQCFDEIIKKTYFSNVKSVQ